MIRDRAEIAIIDGAKYQLLAAEHLEQIEDHLRRIRELLEEIAKPRVPSDPGEDLYQAERRFIESCEIKPTTPGQAARRQEPS